MADCPECGESNPDRASFCLACGTPMPGPQTGADEPVLEGDQLAGTPFVGRADELDLLERIHDRSVGEPSVQLATIIGDPGVGKSRLIAEFHQLCRERRDRSVWREARCRPHEERPYAVLRRIIRSHSQIDDHDSREEVRAKLARTISQVQEGIPRDVDRGWLLARMASLSGVGDRPEETIDRDESFAAWRAFMEAAASLRPLVVVIEDVHWADEGTLAFVEHVTEWSLGVPMLMLCTGRPEIFQGQPGWGGANATPRRSRSRRSAGRRPTSCSRRSCMTRSSPRGRARSSWTAPRAIRSTRRSSSGCWPTAGSSRRGEP